MNAKKSFKKFLKVRSKASDAWVSGDAGPLDALLPKKGDASFFGPMGGVVLGAAKVRSQYLKDSAHFAAGSTNKVEILHQEFGDDLGFVVAQQKTAAKMKGSSKKVPMEIRLTEIYRREKGNWMLVHRHADTLLKAQKK